MTTRSSALRVVGAASVVLLVCAGCGEGEAEAEGTPSPTATSATPTPDVISAEPTADDSPSRDIGNVLPGFGSTEPILEAGQSDEELARDFLDALNVWMHAGEDEVANQWSPADGKDALEEVARSVAEEHYDNFAEALLVDDFDQKRSGSDRYLTAGDLIESHADVLYKSTDGHINNKGEATEGYDVLYEFNDVVDSSETDGTRTITLSMTTISDPFREDFVSSPGKNTVTLVQEGDVMKIEALS